MFWILILAFFTPPVLAQPQPYSVYQAPSCASLFNYQLPAHLLDPRKEMLAARNLLHELQSLAPESRDQIHVSNFAALLPRVLEILDQLPAAQMELPIWNLQRSSDRRGILISDGMTVEKTIISLKKEAHSRLQNQTVSPHWFPEFLIRVLAVEELVYLSQNYSEHFTKFTEQTIQAVQFYLALSPSSLKTAIENFNRSHRARQKSPEDLALSDIQRFYLFWLTALKDLTEREEKGALSYPSMAHWGLADFEDWHLGVFVSGFYPELWVSYDGLSRRRFYYLTHDTSAHRLDDRFWQIRELFTPLRDAIVNRLQKAQLENSARGSLLYVFWHDSTHETNAIYAAFTEAIEEIRSSQIQNSPPPSPNELTTMFMTVFEREFHGRIDMALLNFTSILGSSTYSPIDALIFRITNTRFYGRDIDARILALDPQNQKTEVTSAVGQFYEIIPEAVRDVIDSVIANALQSAGMDVRVREPSLLGVI